MTKLAQLRLVSVGTVSARFEDVTMDFRGSDGHAMESVLWLRNGGGKSSLLSLFFAGILPDQRQFLGKHSGGKERQLSNYIRPSDRGVVVCQWELDSERTLLDGGDAPQYLTGVFYERDKTAEAAGDGEAGSIKRLFFAGMISDDEPRLTLEGLPLFVESSDAPMNRRTMKGFKREWQSLRQQYPDRDVFVTDRHHEWMGQLKSRGIDPQLFSYQLLMNRQEGGASALFSFNDDEDFVDFLLQMALDEQFAQQVRDQMSTFRQELIVRNEQLKPERELCVGLIERMTAFAKISSERTRVNGELAIAQHELSYLANWAQARIESLRNESAETSAKVEESRRAAAETHGQAQFHQRKAAILRRHACQLSYQNAKAQYEASQRAMNEAARLETIWQAAVPLKRALDAERQALNFREDLARKQQVHAPLIETLRRAATDLANALDFEASKLRGEEAACRNAARTVRENARGHRSSAAEAGENAVRAESEAQQFQAALAEAEDERRRLIAEGAIVADETVIAAQQRLDRSIGQLRQELDNLRRDVAARREEQRTCQSRREDAKTRRAEALQEHEKLEADRAEAQRRRQLLEQDAALLRLLETTTVNLDAALSPAIKKADEEKRKSLEAILALRIEAVEDERAIVHLEESGILPPSRDVEVLLDCLSSHRIHCWSGWSYIENNVPKEKRREAIGRRPHLSTGVIVSTDDYQRAVQALQHGTARLQSPVVVAPADAVDGDVPDTWFVAGPSSDAHFDQSAGAHELNAIHDRKTQRDTEVAEHDHWRASLETLSHQLQMFRQEYPSGWFADNEREKKKWELEIGVQDQYIKQADDRDEELQIEIASLMDRERQWTDALQMARSQLDHVQAFLRQHASKESVRLQGRDNALDTVARCRALRQSHLEKADSCDKEAGVLDSEATRTAERAANIEGELTRVVHADQASRHAVAGDLPLLRDNYRLLDQQYQEKVGSDVLIHLAEQKDGDARVERQELARVLAKTSDIRESDVAVELEGLPQERSVQEMSESAHDAHWAAKQKNGQDSKRKDRCEEDMAKAEAKCQELAVTEIPPGVVCPESPEESDAAAQSAEQAAKEENEIAQMYEEDVVKYGGILRDSQQRLEILGKDLASLRGMQQDYESLFSRVSAMPIELAVSARSRTIDDTEVEACSNSIREKLRMCAKDHDALDAQRNEAAGSVHHWAREERFARLTNSVASPFERFEAPALEAKAAYHIEKLDLRLFQIDEKLKEADQQRDIVVRIILSAVDEALRLLTQVSRQSRLPKSLPGAGSQFLQINPSPPENPLDRRARINDLVDELLDKPEILEPMKLIQHAVRRVGSPITVRLLHPDLTESTRRVSITEMQRFSDGERLTCAILLYCTLARLRARQEGYAGNRSSVLLLDNPIGTVSRVRFLDLQREVARAMNIQLIYATGVNDRDAVATLPNVIRLRNSRVDRRTGKRLVELDEPSDGDPDSCGKVEAVRIAFARNGSDEDSDMGSSDGENDESA